MNAKLGALLRAWILLSLALPLRSTAAPVSAASAQALRVSETFRVANPAPEGPDAAAITRVSVASGGTQGDGQSSLPAVSADGRYVAFQSLSANLVVSDTNSSADIFVHDTSNGLTERVSVGSNGEQANGSSDRPSISADGRYVAFVSAATNLVPGDNNVSCIGQVVNPVNCTDVFVHDRGTGQTWLVSRSSTGELGNNYSYDTAISGDGRYVAFTSKASNLVEVDTNAAADVFVHDRLAGTTERVSVSSGGGQASGDTTLALLSAAPAITPDGRFVAFLSAAGNLVSGDTVTCTYGATTTNCYDVFVYDRPNKLTRMASVTPDGLPGDQGASGPPAISADGRYVAFGSPSTDLVAGDTNGGPDTFAYDFITGQTWRASVASDGSEGQAGPYAEQGLPSLSADGRYVAFQSNADLDPAASAEARCTPGMDSDGCLDVFLHDNLTGETRLVSAASNGDPASEPSRYAALSADASALAFVSQADNLAAGDSNSAADVFLYAPASTQPSLSANASTGQPYSVFAFTGVGFTPGVTITVSSNGGAVGSLAADSGGVVRFQLDTQGAAAGRYAITAAGPGAQATFALALDPSAPLVPPSGSGPVFLVPAGTAYTNSIFLPGLLRLHAGPGAGSPDGGPVAYDSGFRLLNLDPANPARLTLAFYDREGGLPLAVTDTLPAGGDATYFPLEDLGGAFMSVPPGFDGSAVVSSDRLLASIVNVVASDGSGDPLAFNASYNGLVSGLPQISLPLLMKDNYGYDTWASVQNLGTAPTDIVLTYSNGATDTAQDVQPGAAARFDQGANAALQFGFVGSAVASSSSDQPLGAAVFEAGRATLFAYSGLEHGSLRPTFPLLNENNSGYVSGLQIQNLGSVASEVTLTFTPSSGWPGTACTETRNVGPGASVNFALYTFTDFVDINPSSLISETCVTGETFIGVANVTGNSAGVELVGILNQLNLGTGKGAAYEGFDPAAPTHRVAFPLVMDRNFGYFTGLNVANAGTALPEGAITCDVSGIAASGPVTRTFTSPALNAGDSWVMVNSPGLPGEIADGFVGSAVCTGPAGSRLAGAVNELNLFQPGDSFMVHEGINLR